MDEQSAATRDEVAEAIRSLTTPDLLKLQDFAEFRVRGLGRAACGRTGEDLLSEAVLSTLTGSENGCNGRRWNRRICFVMHLAGAMRSISSHWKEKFQRCGEPYLESEVPTSCHERSIYRLEFVESNGPPPDRSLLAREELHIIFRGSRGDERASQILAGLLRGLERSEIMDIFKLSEQEFGAAVKRIRRRARRVKEGKRRSD